MGHGRLARARIAHQRHHLPNLRRKSDALEHLLFASRIPEPHRLKANLAAARRHRHGTLRGAVVHADLLIQNLHDPLTRGQRLLHQVELLRQIPDGHPEARGILDEGEQNAHRDDALRHPLVAEPEHRRRRERARQHHRRANPGPWTDHANLRRLMRLGERAVLRSAPRLPPVELVLPHARKVLSQPPVHPRDHCRVRSQRRTNPALVEARNQHQRRHHEEQHRAEQRVDREHHAVEHQHKEDVAHALRKSIREELRERRHIEGGPVHQTAHRVLVKEAHVHRSDVGEDVDPEVVQDQLAQLLHPVGGGHRHTEPKQPEEQRHHAKVGDERSRICRHPIHRRERHLADGIEQVVEGARRAARDARGPVHRQPHNVGRHGHRQRLGHRHEDADRRQQPVRAQVAKQPLEQLQIAARNLHLLLCQHVGKHRVARDCDGLRFELRDCRLLRAHSDTASFVCSCAISA